MFCVNCGKQIGAYARFCPYCGCELPQLSQTASPQAQQPQQPLQPQQPPRPPQPPQKEQSQIEVEILDAEPLPDAALTTELPRVPSQDSPAETTELPRVSPQASPAVTVPLPKSASSSEDAQVTTQMPRVHPMGGGTAATRSPNVGESAAPPRATAAVTAAATAPATATATAPVTAAATAPATATATAPAAEATVAAGEAPAVSLGAQRDLSSIPSPMDPPAESAPAPAPPKRKRSGLRVLLVTLLVIALLAVVALLAGAAGGVFGDERGLEGILALGDDIVAFVAGDDDDDDADADADTDGSPEGQGELVAFYEEIDPETIVEYGDYSYVDGQILVVGASDTSYDEMEALFAEYGGEIVGYLSFSNDYQVNLSGDYTYEELVAVCEQLEGNALVDSAGLAYVEEVSEESVDYTADPWTDSSDTSDTSGSVWDEDDPDGLNWWAEAIGMVSVWEMDLDLSTVKVGIIDSMFDTSNDDLADLFETLLYNPSSITNDHGTHVAGLIAAIGGNGFGITGGAQNVELYGYAYTGNSSSSIFSIFTWKYVLALMFDEGVQVVNTSLGFSKYSVDAANGSSSALTFLEDFGDAMAEFLRKYIDAGYEFLIIDSAGNDGIDASYDYLGVIDDEVVAERIILVGAVKMNDEGEYVVASFSNTGDRVDVWAPGVDILSLSYGDTTCQKDGTSMAAAITSGIAATVWSINPDLTASEVRAILLDLDDDGGSSWFSQVIDWIKDKIGGLFGDGEAEAAEAGDSVDVIDAYRCVQEALETVGSGDSADGGSTGDESDIDDDGDDADDDTWQIVQVDDDDDDGDAATEAVGDATLFETLAGTYVFTSGVGGWATTLTLYADGTFTGAYSDSEMGEMDDDYPDGTVYISEFSGSFSAPVQTSEGVYIMTVESLTVSYTTDSSNLYVDVAGTAIGDEYIIDGIRYVVTTPYGLTGSGETVTVYAPGVSLSDTPMEELEITNVIGSAGVEDGALAVYVIYEAAEEAAFVYYEVLEGGGDSTGTDSAEEAYAKFVEGYTLLTATGSWYEYLQMDIWVSVTDGSQTETESYTYYQDATVSGYDEDDQSSLLITGSGSMDVGTDYVWTYTYEDGVISVTYTQPYNASGEQEQDPAIFGASALTADMMSNVDIVSDSCIEFTVDSSYLDDLGIGALDAIDIAGDVEDLTYSDLYYAVYFDDDGVLTGVYLYFSVTFSMYGYDAFAEYQIYYGFD